jgi:hypothetical protein
MRKIIESMIASQDSPGVIYLMISDNLNCDAEELIREINDVKNEHPDCIIKIKVKTSEYNMSKLEDEHLSSRRRDVLTSMPRLHAWSRGEVLDDFLLPIGQKAKG